MVRDSEYNHVSYCLAVCAPLVRGVWYSHTRGECMRGYGSPLLHLWRVGTTMDFCTYVL